MNLTDINFQLLSIRNPVLNLQNDDSENLPSTLEDLETNAKLSSCHESFTDTLTGYPKYEVGFAWTGCDDQKSLFNDVTFLYNFVDQGKKLAKTLGKHSSE